MILLNGKEIKPYYFTDGTFDLKLDISREYTCERSAVLTWIFENNAETVELYFITRHLQEHGIGNIDLVMPYIPNARQDRVKTDSDVFTLKYFAELINGMRFRCVSVFDPHSAVSEALIDRIIINDAKKNIVEAVKRIGDDNLILFFPDEGAMKRYSEMTEFSFIYGEKKRGMNICGDLEGMAGKSILMVDDICSSGRTLHYAAKKLKEAGVGKIYLYVSHCENIVTESELLKSDIVEKIYTTRSFLRFDHKKFEILEENGIESDIVGEYYSIKLLANSRYVSDIFSRKPVLVKEYMKFTR